MKKKKKNSCSLISKVELAIWDMSPPSPWVAGSLYKALSFHPTLVSQYRIAGRRASEPELGDRSSVISQRKSQKQER